jgi:metal-responsive CopG/Arc/MetJ family transcriptional regulator
MLLSDGVMRVVSVKMDDILLERIDAYAIAHGMNRSEAIRNAIMLLLKQEEEKETFKIRVEKGFPVRRRVRRNGRKSGN